MTPVRLMGPDINDALHKAGAIPEYCFNVTLEITVSKPPTLTYSTYLDTDLANSIAQGILNSIPENQA